MFEPVLRIRMSFSGSGSDPSIFWIRILVYKNRSNSTRPRKIWIAVPVIWDTSVPGSQRIKAIISRTQEGNKKNHEKEDFKKKDHSRIRNCSYGSGSCKIIRIWADPDPQHWFERHWTNCTQVECRSRMNPFTVRVCLVKSVDCEKDLVQYEQIKDFSPVWTLLRLNP